MPIQKAISVLLDRKLKLVLISRITLTKVFKDMYLMSVFCNQMLTNIFFTSLIII